MLRRAIFQFLKQHFGHKWQLANLQGLMKLFLHIPSFFADYAQKYLAFTLYDHHLRGYLPLAFVNRCTTKANQAGQTIHAINSLPWWPVHLFYVKGSIGIYVYTKQCFFLQVVRKPSVWFTLTLLPLLEDFVLHVTRIELLSLRVLQRECCITPSCANPSSSLLWTMCMPVSLCTPTLITAFRLKWRKVLCSVSHVCVYCRSEMRCSCCNGPEIKLVQWPFSEAAKSTYRP